MDLNIRKVKTSDIDTIYELGKNISGFEISEEIVSFWPIKLLKNSVNKKDVIFIAIEKGENIIGFSIMNLNYSLSKGELEDIFIIEQERNKGYGSILLKETIEEAKRRGILHKIEYINALTNTAEGFFEKNNFLKGNKFTWYSLTLTDIFKK